MLEFQFAEIMLLLIVMIVIGVAIGFAIANRVENKRHGGLTVEDLQAKDQQRQQEVNAHFERTAELLHEMTNSYRAVYEHMAESAQQLCDDDAGRPAMARLRAGSEVSEETDGNASALDYSAYTASSETADANASESDSDAVKEDKPVQTA